MKLRVLGVLAFALQITLPALAAPSAVDAYYGKDFAARRARGELRGPELRDFLHRTLKQGHRRGADGFDELGADCGEGAGCTQHRAVGYPTARKLIMGGLFLVREAGGGYGIEELYCDRTVGRAELPGEPIGPGQLPDHRYLNVEHSWPQSQFSRRYLKELQKSDLHHLFPTDSEMNSKRSSYRFGLVERPREALKCQQSELGESHGGGTVFQPPVRARGNIARALFYFSVRYEMAIGEEEEAALREWNRADPPDQAERGRNEEIQKQQGNRNPFVDFPDLADQIRDF